MELVLEYVIRGIADVFTTSSGAFDWMPLVMVVAGLFIGIIVGATPGLNGPFAMALSLPVLIWVFGVSDDALLPILGFLIGLMKGATVGGAVPAILFNTPGTPDAYLTTLDGHPMAAKGEGPKALKVAHISSVCGDTFSDMALFLTAPVLAVLIESVLDLPEKAALIILSLSFMAAVAGNSPIKGLTVGVLGMLLALMGTTLSGNGPRMTFGIAELGNGLPLSSAILGVLIVGEVFLGIEEAARERLSKDGPKSAPALGDNHFRWADFKRIFPNILSSSVIGTAIGALPGIGTTLAATLGYDFAKRTSKTPEKFGTGIPEGVAATEAANSSVSGANLIPVMSLGIPGNFAAVFIILAVESVGDFTLGPHVFRFTEIKEIEGYGTIINKDLVVAFAMFTLMVIANVCNWTLGGVVMRSLGVLARVPKSIMLPVVLLITLTAVYAQDGGFIAIWVVMIFGLIGYTLRRLDISILPFVIGFLLSPRLEELVRGGYSASGGDPLFLLKSPIALAFLVASVLIVYFATRKAS
ncbi:MAG: tripartite tricarboxylate transporter permease [Rhodospirillales bacterium]|nr:tripartite tricarboxylate transporter permease [Rhodospirillales bacterium]MBO6786194.1 tripartite tricarboxylate transporter permease [Rhodospirillales bacterium]